MVKALPPLLLSAALALPWAPLMAAYTVQQRLDLLERRVGQVTELTLQMDELRRENRQLRGEIERLGHQLQQLERKQRDIYLDIDQRLSAAERGKAQTPQAALPAAAGPEPATPVVERTGSAPAAAAVDRSQVEAEYQAAYALLTPQQRRFDEAAVALSRFLEKYPEDELAPNAQYWLGEAYYVSQKNAEAQKAFEAVISRYPGSAKASDALFKIGRIQQAEGKRDAARASYTRVLQDYPDSPAAGLARQRLEQMGR
jgi:tol-pal system protein YbgF